MHSENYSLWKLTSLLNCGGVGDLRSACDLADRIVAAAKRFKDGGVWQEGSQAFRARVGYEELLDQEGRVDNLSPLVGDQMRAPPKDKVKLGRFNAPGHPVLYLSTKKEIALAETRVLPSDACTIAIFKTVRPLKFAHLMRVDEFFDDNAREDIFLKRLLAESARFVSRRVADHERDLHYRACNLIASAFKDSGFEGLIYRTSFWSKGWRGSEGVPRDANIVIFDPEAAVPIKSSLYKIDWARPEAQCCGNSVWYAPDAGA